MATQIIPGVSVQVLREIVPPLPSPSGVLGIVGIAQQSTERLTPVSSFPSFLETYGAATSFTIPEVRQAFQNGIAEVVVSPLGGGGAGAANLLDADNGTVASLTARANGPWSKNIQVTVAPKGSSPPVVDVTVALGDVQETFRNLAGPEIVAALNVGSALGPV